MRLIMILSIRILKNDPMLCDFSTLLNRLSGMADEMSSYFRRMKEEKVNMEREKAREKE